MTACSSLDEKPISQWWPVMFSNYPPPLAVRSFSLWNRLGKELTGPGKALTSNRKLESGKMGSTHQGCNRRFQKH